MTWRLRAQDSRIGLGALELLLALTRPSTLCRNHFCSVPAEIALQFGEGAFRCRQSKVVETGMIKSSPQQIIADARTGASMTSWSASWRC